MGGCTAINCHNSDKKHFRMFNYPTDKERQKRWVLNTRRDKFVPTKSSQLREIHFEPSQFEKNCADGWKKLKPNAVPTLFNILNPPPRFDTNRQSKYKDSNGILKSEDIPALENNSEPCESISEELPVSIASIVSIA
ncbi:THAP domain-containing protein 2-like [Aphis gossypii]|uniref:THAP domain-containing protein 2-like n=1 Tax=Aphis gossypii TaxID=80765 RepID=UPI002159165B|nr:THAP domain-containing protein 2-like [Aphis gossypii]